MKKRQAKMLVFAAVLLLFCAGCKRKAVVYDSGEEAVEAFTQDSTDILESVSSQVEHASDAEDEDVFGTQDAERITLVCVYVCGEVNHPGVYELPLDARVNDAIEAAGGMTDAAAGTYLNLAEKISDGQKIEVPSEEEAEDLEAAAKEQEETARAQESGLVNLNTATAEQLMTLTGIGEAKANDILEYRETHGGFSSVEELMEIPGIKSGVFQKIKDKITI